MAFITPTNAARQRDSTPRNEPAPPINPRLQETLTAIGGIVPEGGGDDAGMPVYRLAYGQSERHFSRGRMRIRFPDTRIPTVLAQERFFVAPEVFTRAAAWQTERENQRWERFLDGDFTIFAESEPLSGYLHMHEAFLDYLRLEDAIGSRSSVNADIFSIAQSVTAPPDWIYLCDVTELHTIGRRCWYVMRWIPSSSHGGRAQWNDLRYATDAFVPELNATVAMIDDLGEYPENGFWIPRLEIAEYPPDENGDYHPANYEYTEPTEANCVQPVVEMLYERAQLTNQDQNQAYRAKKEEEELHEMQTAAYNSANARISDALGVDAIKIY